MKRLPSLAGLSSLCLAALVQTAAAAPLLDLTEPLARYERYVGAEADLLVARTGAFTEAVKAGDLDRAKALYAPARVHFERIEPVAELFGDLDPAIDARADDFEAREQDPAFTGFHRLEYGLFAEGSTEGLAGIADRLMDDIVDLRGRIAELSVPPEVAVGGAAALLEEVAATKISGEEERYSRTDLWDLDANLDGARQIVELLRPQIAQADGPLLARIDGDFQRLHAILAGYRTAEGGFQSYDLLSPQDRRALQGPVTALAESLSMLRGTLGLE